MAIQSNKEAFNTLVKTRRRMSLSLTFLILFIYFGFICLIGFKKDWLSIKVGEHITMAIPVGIGVIIFSWILTGIYIGWANNKYDKAVEVLKKELLKK